MATTYSFKKGFYKGLLSLLSIGAAGLVFAGLSDVSLADLVTRYVVPALGSLTVGGAVTIVINFLKVRSQA